MTAEETMREVDDLIAASSLGTSGIAEPGGQAPPEVVAAILRSSVARDAVEDLAVALESTVGPSRAAREGLAVLEWVFQTAGQAEAAIRLPSLRSVLLDQAAVVATAPASSAQERQARTDAHAALAQRLLASQGAWSLAHVRDDPSDERLTAARCRDRLPLTGPHRGGLTHALNHVFDQLVGIMEDRAARERLTLVLVMWRVARGAGPAPDAGPGRGKDTGRPAALPARRSAEPPASRGPSWSVPSGAATPGAG